MSDQERRIYGEHARQALEAARRGESELASVYERIATRIKTRILRRGENVTVFEIKGEIDRAFLETFERRVKAIERAMTVGAGEGPKAAERTVKLVPRLDEAQPVRATVTAAPRAARKASAQIAARTDARPRVPVSQRIRRWDTELGAEMAREVDRGIKQRKGILGAAREIQKLDEGRLHVDLPQYLKRVEEVARAGNMDELKLLSKGYLTRAQKLLGELQTDGTRKASAYSLRGATTRFLRDVQKAGPEGVDKLIDRYVKERAQYQARLIARHETVEAFRESYVRSSSSKEGVVGFRWLLSNRHVVPDECDVFAHTNHYGLGPGGYPADAIPQRHPSCLCTIVAILDRDHFKRANNPALPRAYVDTASPDAVGWMINNEGIAQRILGPTRWAAFKRGIPVLDAQGRPLLVRDVLGRMPSSMAAE